MAITDFMEIAKVDLTGSYASPLVPAQVTVPDRAYAMLVHNTSAANVSLSFLGVVLPVFTLPAGEYAPWIDVTDLANRVLLFTEDSGPEDDSIEIIYLKHPV